MCAVVVVVFCTRIAACRAPFATARRRNDMSSVSLPFLPRGPRVPSAAPRALCVDSSSSGAYVVLDDGENGMIFWNENE